MRVTELQSNDFFDWCGISAVVSGAGWFLSAAHGDVICLSAGSSAGAETGINRVSRIAMDGAADDGIPAADGNAVDDGEEKVVLSLIGSIVPRKDTWAVGAESGTADMDGKAALVVWGCNPAIDTVGDLAISPV
jgi:hypothetical protein